MIIQDTEYMQQALRLAKRGLYTTDPNPRVGCVLVKSDQVVGEGWHKRAGEAHAEIMALENASENARGATAYVTLEPCCHTGKTGPCTEALIKAGVSRVVAAMKDPNPEVSGKGLELLQQNNITTSSGLLQSQARELNPGFIKRMETGRPYVRLKMAMSLDGRTAMASGESQWISGEAARRDVQLYRARSSAILTGIGTVLADDPSMNVRLSSNDLDTTGDVRQPMRVVLDSQLRFPANARICQSDGEVVVITCTDRSLEKTSAEIVRLQADGDLLNLDEVMIYLAGRGVNEVHVEAGPLLNGGLLRRKLIDEIIIYMAPHIMGDNARGLFSLPEITMMQQRVSLDIVDIRSVGHDLRITARPVYVS